MAYLNYALRFLLELCGIAALAAWGWSAADGMPLRLVAAVAAPAALVVAWALVVAPKARNPIPQTVRMLIGTVLLLGCAAALAWAGHQGPAAAFAILNVLNTVVLLVVGGPGETPNADRTPDPSGRA